MSEQAPNAFVARLVWIVLVISQGIYLLVPTPEGREGAPELFTQVLLVVAVTEGLAILAFFRLAAVAKIQKGDLDPRTPEGMGRLFVVLMLCWVLSESVAIYGLVLRFMGAPFGWVAVFALGGFVLMMATNPFQAGLKPPLSSAERGRDASPIG